MNLWPTRTDRTIGGARFEVIATLGLAVLFIVSAIPGASAGGPSASEGGLGSTRGNPAFSASATSSPVFDTSGYPVSGAVSFDGSASGGVFPYAYRWEFGDGASSFDPRPQHRYAAPGAYITSLTVPDFLGAVTTSTLFPSVSFENGFPYRILTIPPIGSAPLDVGFLIPGVPEEEWGYRWDFGDGNLSTSAHPTHRYTTAGTYMARVDLTGPIGFAHASRITVIASQSEPLRVLASYASELTGTCNPVTVTVDFQSAIAGGTGPYSHLWDFGDSETSPDPQPSHTYRVILRDLDVQVRATDADGNVATSTVMFRPPPPPCAPSLGGSVGGLGGVALGATAFVMIVLLAVFTPLLRKKLRRT